MINFVHFTKSVSQYTPSANKALVIVFGAGSSCVDSDGWNGGIAMSFYENLSEYGEITITIGASTNDSRMSRFLNTIATSGGSTSRNTPNVSDNGVGAMGNWLSPKEYDRSTLRSDLETYVNEVWPELLNSEQWDLFMNILTSQQISNQTLSQELSEYSLEKDAQPGAMAVIGGVAVDGAAFVLMETSDR